MGAGGFSSEKETIFPNEKTAPRVRGGPRRSSFFFKTGAAVAAGDGNFPLPLGDAELLATVGTAEIAVLLVPAAAAVDIVTPDGGSHETEKTLVFLLAAGDISGKHAQKHGKQEQVGQQPEQLRAKEEGEQGEEKIDPKEGNAELIQTVTAIHDSPDPIHRAVLLSS